MMTVNHGKIYDFSVYKRMKKLLKFQPKTMPDDMFKRITEIRLKRIKELDENYPDFSEAYERIIEEE